MKKLILLVAAVSVGCSPEIRTYFDYDHKNDVAQYQTYSWSKLHQADMEQYPLFYSELNDKRIRSSVDDLLKIRGYILKDSCAELTLHYAMNVEERSVLWPDPYGYMYGDYFMRPRSDIFKYREATLILGISKSPDSALIWRGWAVGVLEIIIDEGSDVDVAIKSAVAKILKDFPASHAPPINMTVR
jgi:hypothetical protein